VEFCIHLRDRPVSSRQWRLRKSNDAREHIVSFNNLRESFRVVCTSGYSLPKLAIASPRLFVLRLPVCVYPIPTMSPEDVVAKRALPRLTWFEPPR
jgi:hypothetical protein